MGSRVGIKIEKKNNYTRDRDLKNNSGPGKIGIETLSRVRTLYRTDRKNGSYIQIRYIFHTKVEISICIEHLHTNFNSAKMKISYGDVNVIQVNLVNK